MVLSPAFVEALQVPETYEDLNHNYQVANFAFVIEPILKLLGPSDIVEIGSDKGSNTRRLAQLARQLGATLHVVDPTIPGDAEFGEGVNLYKKKSSQFFDTVVSAQAWIIDGDHNYRTVTMELGGAMRARREGDPLLLILHDVSWPCARRDMFYDPTDSSCAVLVDHSAALEGGLIKYGNMPTTGIANRVEEGGPENGVLTAIEDFVSQYGSRFRYHQTHGFFGLAVIYESETMPNAVAEEIERIFHGLAVAQPLVSSLEANRLRLLQSYFDQLDQIESYRAVIAELRGLSNTAQPERTTRRLKAEVELLRGQLEEAHHSCASYKAIIAELRRERT